MRTLARAALGVFAAMSLAPFPAAAAPCPGAVAAAPHEVRTPTRASVLGPTSGEELVATMLDAARGELSGTETAGPGISAGMGQWLQAGADFDGNGTDDALHVQLNPPGLNALRGHDGSAMWTTQFSGFVFPHPGVTLDSVPGQDMLVIEVIPRFVPPTTFEWDLAVHGISGTGATLWKVSYRNTVLTTPAGPVVLDVAGVTSLRDLDGDGSPELIVARYQQVPAQKLLIGTFEILSSRDGKRVGTLDPVVQVDGASFPFAFAAPDFTGDGLADIVSASFTREDMTIKGHVGRAPAPVWVSRLPLEGRVLSWGIAGTLDADDRADVLFGFRCPSAGAAETRIVSLSGRDGTQMWTRTLAEGYAFPQLAGNTDGSDLLTTSQRADGPRFSLLDGGTGGSIWTRDLLGKYWPYVGDATGDAFPDLLSIAPEGHQIVSGRDGAIRWTRAGTTDGREVVWPVGGDLDGDGSVDLLMGHERSDKTVDVSPLSGATGEELWPQRIGFLGGPLYGHVLDVRRDAPGVDLLESFWTPDAPDGFAARPGTGGKPLWTRPT